MAKLFPPLIDSKLPAFGVSLDSQERVYIEVPFTMNRAVSEKDFSKMAIIIKTIQTNTIIAEKTNGIFIADKKIVKFDITEEYSKVVASKKITPGQFYKIQIAYIDNNDVIGYYSSIGIIKCTTYPSVIVENYDVGYYGSFEFIGRCSWEEEGQDTTEKVYSYSFTLKDNNENIIATSGEQLHNSSTDTNTKYSIDAWFLNKNLIEGIQYNLVYSVKTINGLEHSSQSYPIVQAESIDPNLPCELIAKCDQDDGCIQLYLRPRPGEDRTLTGTFLISRSNSKDNYSSWDEIYRFSYTGVAMKGRDMGLPSYLWDINDILLWEDFTVEQGVSYIYSIQAYNSNGLYSSRIKNKRETLLYDNEDFWVNTIFEEEEIKVDFEDVFLFDGKIQLKVRFNPKISSFKSTVFESKVDTIGGPYPFIFRNGNVNYKEFPVSGLISLLSDSNERFFRNIQKENKLRENTFFFDANEIDDQNYVVNYYKNKHLQELDACDFDTDLTADNFYRERQFKLKVLNWLTNGEPKLFRSPSEGNYIVRLLNTSLTPMDQLGRMLHSFQSTAYEIAEPSFENLNKYGFIYSPISHFKNFAMAEIKIAGSEYLENNNRFKIPAVGGGYAVAIKDATPGTILILDYLDNENSISYEIGATGTYIVPIQDKAVYYIDLVSGNWDNAKVSYWYYSINPVDNFSIISNIKGDLKIKKIIGPGYPQNEDEYETLNIVSEKFKPNPDISVYNKLNDIKRDLGQFYNITITQRNLILCLFDSNSGKYYEFKEYNIGPEISDWIETSIYAVYDYSTKDFLGYMYNINDKEKLSTDQPDFRFKLNDDPMIDFMGNNNSYLLETKSKDNLPQTYGAANAIYTNINKVERLYAGNGLVLDVSYREKYLEYSFEDNHLEIKTAKENYEYAYAIWYEDQNNKIKLSQLEKAYESYINSINEVYWEEWENFYGSNN